MCNSFCVLSLSSTLWVHALVVSACRSLLSPPEVPAGLVFPDLLSCVLVLHCGQWALVPAFVGGSTHEYEAPHCASQGRCEYSNFLFVEFRESQGASAGSSTSRCCSPYSASIWASDPLLVSLSCELSAKLSSKISLPFLTKGLTLFSAARFKR